MENASKKMNTKFKSCNYYESDFFHDNYFTPTPSFFSKVKLDCD